MSIKEKFTSGNNIPVTRATITRDELEAHDKATSNATLDYVYSEIKEVYDEINARGLSKGYVYDTIDAMMDLVLSLKSEEVINDS